MKTEGEMINRNINAVYFSATGTTEKIVCHAAEKLAKTIQNQGTVTKINFTLPAFREQPASFSEADIVIMGVPVYAGRVPNVLLKYLNTFTGNGAWAVPVVVYGNRHYDDALIELNDILETTGFKVIAGAAFIGEHSFSKILGKDRPDEKDIAIVDEFADGISQKIINNQPTPVTVKGNRPYRRYYVPVNAEGIPVDIRKVTPKTNNDCTDCKLCADICPMGSIDYDDVSRINGICIKCGACIKSCPAEAKYYDDEDYLRHKQELEIQFTRRSEPELFV